MTTRKLGCQRICVLAVAVIVVGFAHRAAMAEIVYTPVNGMGSHASFLPFFPPL